MRIGRVQLDDLDVVGTGAMGNDCVQAVMLDDKLAALCATGVTFASAREAPVKLSPAEGSAKAIGDARGLVREIAAVLALRLNLPRRLREVCQVHEEPDLHVES